MNKYVYATHERPKSGLQHSRATVQENQTEKKTTQIRPVSASISSFSHIENKRQMKKNLENAQDPLFKSLEFLKKSKIAEFSLPDKQVNTMLVHLDRITRNTMYGQKRIELRENEKIAVELLPGESQFTYVNTKGQTCPLNILIQKAQGGALETYVSRKIKEPTKIMNDETYTSDIIRLTDKSFFFICPFIALNFTAVKETKFTVWIKFGQRLVLKKKKEFTMSAPSLIGAKKSFMDEEYIQKKPPIKNFIKLNQTYHFIKTPDNLKEAEKKRTQVKERHRNIQLEIQEKRKSYIKKHELRLDAELKGMEILDIIRRKQNFEKFWITFAFLSRSLLYIRRSLKDSRQKKLKKFLKNNAARKIQKRFHKLLVKNPIKNKIDDLIFNSLKLFGIHSRFSKAYDYDKIFKCITESAKNRVLPTKFNILFKKINLIQVQFREYQVTNQIRLQELDDLWIQTLTAKIEKINSYKKKSKKWKKKMLEKYSSISDDVKAKVLIDYLANSKRKFLDKLKEHKEKNKDKDKKFSFEQRKKFIESEMDVMIYMCPPLFDYLPTQKEMMKLINSILGSNEEKDDG